MSHKASPVMLGAFVLGAMLLALGGVILLGAKDLFRKSYPLVSYFQSSVNGLREGAPVKFKGVEIGSVSEVRLPLTRHPHDAPVIVFYSIDARKLRSSGQEELPPDELQHAIEGGLRARLEQESFVTGLLYLSLVFLPEAKAKLHEPIEGIPEIPTAPTEFEELTTRVKRFAERLEHVDLVALVDDLHGTVQAVEELFRSGQVQGAFASLDRTLASVGDTATALRQEIAPLVESLQAASERVDAVGIDVQQSVVQSRQTLEKIGSLVTSLETSTQELASSLEATLQSARVVIDPGSPPVTRLERALAELGETARAARTVLELLERDPAALVRGKGTPEEQR